MNQYPGFYPMMVPQPYMVAVPMPPGIPPAPPPTPGQAMLARIPVSTAGITQQLPPGAALAMAQASMGSMAQATMGGMAQATMGGMAQATMGGMAQATMGGMGRPRLFEELKQRHGFPAVAGLTQLQSLQLGMIKLEGEELEMPQDDTPALLDDYNSDLNLVIDSDGYGAAPLTQPPGFCFTWSGVRSTHGFCTGKAYFEVRITEQLPVEFGDDHQETDPHILRVGWSVDSATLQLGEDPNSYGYGGTGKFSVNCKFQNYGEPFGVGDVIGTLLDFDARGPSISYTKNGKWLGLATPLKGFTPGQKEMALFPHVLSKNCRFRVNYGQEAPWFPPPAGFPYVLQRSSLEMVRGMKAPEKKSDCEMLMIVGLPGAGKTTWGLKMRDEHSDKRYNIIGSDTLIDKMKVMGLPRKNNYHGRWETLIDKATKCLNKLFEIASKKNRNYILDQTNVYPSARKRKMKNFNGFLRKAAVLQPDDPELKRREHKRTYEDGKFVPETAVLEMKANFKLPQETDDNFDVIEFVELPREKCIGLVEQYNLEGQRNRPPQQGKGFQPDRFKPPPDFRQDQYNQQPQGHQASTPSSHFTPPPPPQQAQRQPGLPPLPSQPPSLMSQQVFPPLPSGPPHYDRKRESPYQGQDAIYSQPGDHSGRGWGPRHGEVGAPGEPPSKRSKNESSSALDFIKQEYGEADQSPQWQDLPVKEEPKWNRSDFGAAAIGGAGVSAQFAYGQSQWDQAAGYGDAAAYGSQAYGSVPEPTQSTPSQRSSGPPQGQGWGSGEQQGSGNQAMYGRDQRSGYESGVKSEPQDANRDRDWYGRQDNYSQYGDSEVTASQGNREGPGQNRTQQIESQSGGNQWESGENWGKQWQDWQQSQQHGNMGDQRGGQMSSGEQQQGSLGGQGQGPYRAPQEGQQGSHGGQPQGSLGGKGPFGGQQQGSHVGQQSGPYGGQQQGSHGRQGEQKREGFGGGHREQAGFGRPPQPPGTSSFGPRPPYGGQKYDSQQYSQEKQQNANYDNQSFGHRNQSGPAGDDKRKPPGQYQGNTQQFGSDRFGGSDSSRRSSEHTAYSASPAPPPPPQSGGPISGTEKPKRERRRPSKWDTPPSDISATSPSSGGQDDTAASAPAESEKKTDITQSYDSSAPTDNIPQDQVKQPPPPQGRGGRPPLESTAGEGDQWNKRFNQQEDRKPPSLLSAEAGFGGPPPPGMRGPNQRPPFRPQGGNFGPPGRGRGGMGGPRPFRPRNPQDQGGMRGPPPDQGGMRGPRPFRPSGDHGNMGGPGRPPFGPRGMGPRGQGPPPRGQGPPFQGRGGGPRFQRGMGGPQRWQRPN